MKKHWKELKTIFDNDNRSFKDFKKKHQKKINQVIYSSISVENENFLINLINNFLSVKNSFAFESVEKGKIRGRYTILEKTLIKFGNLITTMLIQ